MFSSLTLQVYLLSIGSLLLGRVVWSIWKAYSNPLRTVPGPWYSRFTNWRLKLAVLSGSRIHYIHALHARYGPVVRVSPNEVAVADAASFREVYRIGSGFLKTDWYLATGENKNNIPAIFNMIDPKEHGTRRRLLSKGFSQRLLRENWERTVRDKVAFAVRRIKEEAAVEGASDVMKWWTFMTTDITSELMFGDSFRMLELGHNVPYVDALKTALIQMTLSWELPWLYRLMKLLPLSSLQPITQAAAILHEQGRKAIQDSKARGIMDRTIFAPAIKESEKEGSTLTDDDLRVEAANFIVAGSDTTAITLTYLIWAVLKRSKLQKELQAELTSVEEVTDENLEKLPILNAVIEETLRLYGAVPSTLPRRTPYGGVTLQGHYIPERTVVGAQAFSMHRNPEVFPDPEKFLPSTPLSPAAKASFSPFGGGSRNCLGINLARMEMRHGVAQFFRECGDASLAPSTTDKSMEMENFFIITPKAHKCEITL